MVQFLMLPCLSTHHLRFAIFIARLRYLVHLNFPPLGSYKIVEMVQKYLLYWHCVLLPPPTMSTTSKELLGGGIVTAGVEQCHHLCVFITLVCFSSEIYSWSQVRFMISDLQKGDAMMQECSENQV